MPIHRLMSEVDLACIGSEASGNISEELDLGLADVGLKSQTSNTTLNPTANEASANDSDLPVATGNSSLNTERRVSNNLDAHHPFDEDNAKNIVSEVILSRMLSETQYTKMRMETLLILWMITLLCSSARIYVKNAN